MFFFWLAIWECPEILFFILRNSESEFGSETVKNEPQKRAQKVDIFGHSPRGNKLRIINSKLSETGGRAVQKLWTFQEKFADF
jgi:hypothetical protein